MICETCGNKEPKAIRISYPKEGKQMACDNCGSGFGCVPDIYFKGTYTDENLSSEEYPGPKLIRSRQDKKFWLEKCNLREAGDRVHGATSFDPISHRHAMDSLNGHKDHRRK